MIAVLLSCFAMDSSAAAIKFSGLSRSQAGKTAVAIRAIANVRNALKQGSFIVGYLGVFAFRSVDSYFML
jgi:hypothetical protein